MTSKQRKLFDAIMTELIRIDKSDAFKYYLTTLQIDLWCSHFQRRTNECTSFAEIHATRTEFYEVVSPLRDYKNTARLADFFCRSPFKFPLRYYLREMYIKVKSGEPFYFECDYTCFTLNRVLCYLRKM